MPCARHCVRCPTTGTELSGPGAGETAVTDGDRHGRREAQSHEDSARPRSRVTCRPCCWAEHLTVSRRTDRQKCFTKPSLSIKYVNRSFLHVNPSQASSGGTYCTESSSGGSSAHRTAPPPRGTRSSRRPRTCFHTPRRASCGNKGALECPHTQAR